MPDDLVLCGETEPTDEAAVLDLAGRHCSARETVMSNDGTRRTFEVAVVAVVHPAAVLLDAPHGHRVLGRKVVVQLGPVAEIGRPEAQMTQDGQHFAHNHRHRLVDYVDAAEMILGLQMHTHRWAVELANTAEAA